MKYVIVLGDGMADEYIPSIRVRPLKKQTSKTQENLQKPQKSGL